MTIKTVLFDLDGTIIDSNELIINSFEYTFKQYNHVLTREELIQFNGPPLRETFENVDFDRADEMIKTYQAHNFENHKEYIQLFPNVIETIKRLKDNNIAIGIVSSKTHKGILLGLELTGLRSYFETIVGIDDVVHPKPHPESVVKAMNELDGKIPSTIIVGDNYHDIQAGKNAGIRTAGVAWSHKGKEYLETYEPTYMLEDMLDLLDIVGV